MSPVRRQQVTQCPEIILSTIAEQSCSLGRKASLDGFGALTSPVSSSGICQVLNLRTLRLLDVGLPWFEYF